jgi:hypothetical protein
MDIEPEKHTEINTEYIYLIMEREFIESNKNIYKIGRTKQKNLDRLHQYPKQSILLFQIACIDSIVCEKNLKQIFSEIFIKHPEIGTEYFQGNPNQMIDIIYKYLKKPNEIQVINQEIILEQQKNEIISQKNILEKQEIILERQKNEIILQEIILEKQRTEIIRQESVLEQRKAEIINEEQPISEQQNDQEQPVVEKNYKYFCEECIYGTNIKQNYEQHISSNKHKKVIENQVKLYVCKCNKPYMSYMGYWTHKNECPIFLSSK